MESMSEGSSSSREINISEKEIIGSGLRRMASSTKLRQGMLKVKEETCSQTPNRKVPPIRIRSSSCSESLGHNSAVRPLRKMRTPSTPIRLLPEEFMITKDNFKPMTFQTKNIIAPLDTPTNINQKSRTTPIRIYADSNKTITNFKPAIPSLSNVPEDEKTPPTSPGMTRTTSGSMLLRATPERIRRRSGSLTRLNPSDQQNTPTPICKRKRTISLSEIGRETRRRSRTPSEDVIKRAKPTPQSPMKRFRSDINLQHIKFNAIYKINPENVLKSDVDFTTPPNHPPPIFLPTSPIKSYYCDKTPVLTPQTSVEKTQMVPQMKKQISIDSGIPTEDDDEFWFGDSTKTIKKGQGTALARSLSLKLSPKKDFGENEIEKSCSTPALPTTAPLSRQTSTSSLRFKISPSSYLVPQIETTPSTSHHEENGKKSVLRIGRNAEKFKKRIQFLNLSVFYFERKQGEWTVPSEGEVALDMNNEHHTHRIFSLVGGKRPSIDLRENNEEELSEGEVCGPDSDEDREYSRSRTILPIKQKLRIKILKQSGVKVEKKMNGVEILRKKRAECGCSCENGICLPETCQCSLDGVQCQVDGEEFENGEIRLFPCQCFGETCTNPNGRIFYDPDKVNEHRRRAISNWNAAVKTGIYGSPQITKFLDSDEDEERGKNEWLLRNAIPIKNLETPPTKFPVTPVYTRRSRSSLSDIRESISETQLLSERMNAMQNLENDVCVEEEKEQDVTITEFRASPVRQSFCLET